jgi:hypothetical protein
MKMFVSRKVVLGLAAVVGLGSLAATPQTANADWRVGIDIRDGWRQQDYDRRETRVWVEPVYRTVCDRVWVAPTYQTVCERVWVPDRYEDRQVVRYYGWQRRIEFVRVLVQPAHYEDQQRQVEVASGHWQDVQRQELVAAGHWETRVERVAYCEPGPVIDRMHFQFGHR